jgi:4-amino-4-deoxy-L-arabinose transferase-like glycosyltransferase
VWHTPIPDGDLVRAIEYVQAVIGALTILLVFMLARRVFDVRTGLIAAALVAFYPNLITITATLQLETFFIALSLLAVLVLVPAAAGDDTRVVRLVAGGALTGAVALVRPTIALLIVAFLVTRWIARTPWRKLVRDFALVAISMIAIIVPWTIRNAVALHAFVPVSTGIGPALCMSRNQEATGGLDTAILVRQCSPPDQKIAPGTGDTETNSYATRHAVHWVVAHPLEEVKFWWWRMDLAYRHDTSGLDQYEGLMGHRARRLADAVSDDVSFVVLGLALIGAAIVVTGRRPARGLFLVATTLAFAIVPAILFGDPRYRVPAEPFFAILAAVPLAFCFAAVTRHTDAR